MSVAPHLATPLSILVFSGVLFAIAATNAVLMRRLRSFRALGNQPRVSVLVPARDEEGTIGACVRSLLAQDYPDFEVVVLNDGSRDRTADVLAGFDSDRLRVLTGQPLPAGWNGKPWACSQLAEVADGELLFFTDADTVHEPDTLRQTVAALESSESDFISAIVRNEVATLGEQLTVPFIVWSVAVILPLGVAYLMPRSKAFSAANGKFMMFRREAYEGVGGHAAARDEAAEDLAICRLIKAAGFKWRLLDATDCVSTRMYDGFRSAMLGFSKNFFAIFDYRVFSTVFAWFWILLVTYYPPVVAVARGLRGEFDGHFWAAATTILLLSLTWLLVSAKTRLPLHLFLLYPLTMTVSAGIGLWSMALTIAGRTRWKGRSLVQHRVRFF